MKTIRKAAALLLAAVMTIIFAVPSFATLMENNGLEVSIETDRESYEEGAAITATITVTNTNEEAVHIMNLEQLVPEGYVLAELLNEDAKDIELKKGESVSIKVSYVGENPPAEENKVEDFLNNLIYGETWVIPNILLVLGGIAGLIIFWKLT